MDKRAKPILSPCIGVCKIEAIQGRERCAGCFRSLDEIVRWGKMPPAEREKIMARVAGEVQNAQNADDAS